jgi:acetolactate synthase-1/3 small subunit
MFRILICTTDNEPGVLDRVASTFRRRGFNIHSLTVSPTLDPLVSRMTLVTDLKSGSTRSPKAFLERLLNVHSVVDLTEVASLVRDVALLRVRATAENRPALFQLAQIFHAEVLDVSPDSLMLSVCASPERIEALLESLRPYGLLELGRSGAVAMQRSTSIEALPLATASEDIEDAVSF